MNQYVIAFEVSAQITEDKWVIERPSMLANEKPL